MCTLSPTSHTGKAPMKLTILFCLFRAEDPIFNLAAPLRPDDEDSHTRAVIARHAGSPKDDSFGEPGGAAEATAVQGGWFGRGYGKGRKKKKTA